MIGKRVAAIASGLILLASLAAAAFQPAAPQLPPRVYEIVQTLAARHAQLAHGDDEARRALTKMIVQQIVFEFPDQGYGWKRAGHGRPESKDCFARKVGTDLWCWDWQLGSTREVLDRFFVHYIPDQVFVSVPGADHLGAHGPPAPAPTVPTPAPAPPEEPALIDRIAMIEARITALEDLQRQLVNAAGDISLAVRDLRASVDAERQIEATNKYLGPITGRIVVRK